MATLCSGCVPFVAPVPPLGYVTKGKPIDEKLIAFIQADRTTKGDVVWELGAPDSSGTDWISYTTWRHRGGVIGGIAIVLPRSGGAVVVERLCRRPQVLTIWFDETAVVTRRELASGESLCEVKSETIR